MRLTRQITGLMSFLAIAALVACGGGGGDTGGAEGGGETATPAGTPPAAVADAGSVNGTIDFTGSAPANEPIDMGEEPACAEKHSSPPTRETVVANEGKLANVFVYVKEGLTGEFPAPSEAVEVDQNGCVYIPHVIGVQTGQDVAFKNSDGLLHNIKAAPTENRPFNISQPNNMTSPRSFSAQEVMVPVQCDVHGWMEMYIGVVDHPYFAVSGDDGSFTIENLPPGSYTLEAWHERYGVQTQQVTVEPNGTATVTFAYNASMAANAVVPLGTPIDPHGHHQAGDR
jgi:plastocyanin